MKDISFIVFTNERYFNLLELTLPYNIKNTSHLNKKIYVVSNKIPDTDLLPNINYISGNVDFSDNGGHFGRTLLNALKQINEDYVLFLCDDYLITSPINKERFDKLIPIMEDVGGDYFSFASYRYIDHFISNWPSVNLDLTYYGYPNSSIREFDPTTRHMYSVQPCLWKRSSLIELLTYNQNITLHQLDNTDIFNKKGEKRVLVQYDSYENKSDFLDYNFKNLCYYHPPLTYNFDERNLYSDFLLMDYIEVVRHGKFINYNSNTKTYLDNILQNEITAKTKEKLERFMN